MTKELTFSPTRPDGLLRPPTLLSHSYVGSILREVRHLPRYVQRLKTAGTFPTVPHTTTLTFTLNRPLHVYIIYNKYVYSREQL
jgi:hypothetical protein